MFICVSWLWSHSTAFHSYYPLFPPEEGVNFDFAHIDNVAMPITPDVLLLPSKLRYFAKVRLHDYALAMNEAP